MRLWQRGVPEGRRKKIDRMRSGEVKRSGGWKSLWSGRKAPAFRTKELNRKVLRGTGAQDKSRPKQVIFLSPIFLSHLFLCSWTPASLYVTIVHTQYRLPGTLGDFSDTL